MEINIMHHRTASRLLTMLFFAAMFVACSDNSDEPQPGEEEYLEMTAEEEMHYRLIRNFYKVAGFEGLKYMYEPSKGLVLDEAKPRERSVESESYELALNKFEKCLPSTENAGDFIIRDSNGITVSLGTFGSVIFSQASGDGVVAKAVISLKDAPEYTLLYRLPSSFGDNEQNFKNQYNPGDIVSFICIESKYDGYIDYSKPEEIHGKWKPCREWTTGVVIDVDEQSMSVLTSHCHQVKWTKKFDGDLYLNVNCPSEEDWQKIYDSWKVNRDLFIYTCTNNSEKVVHSLYDIMEGIKNIYGTYVCVSSEEYYVCYGGFSFRQDYIVSPVLKLATLRLGKDLKAWRREFSWQYGDLSYITHRTDSIFTLQTIDFVNRPKLLYPVN